jgi:type VI protein secretion system component Hcp
MLALQRQIGNRAVGALLAREPTKTPPKMPTPKPPELKDGIYAIVPGIGTIELHSAQLGAHRHTTSPAGRGNSREPAAPPTEIVVTSHLGDHSDKLFRWSVVGEPATVEIRFIKGGKAYLTIRLHRALISSYSVSGHGGGVEDRPLESWVLNGMKIEYEAEMAPAADSPPG